MTRSGARKLPVLLVTSVALAMSAVAVSASTGVARASIFTPDCVKPGASTTEMITYPGPSANRIVTKGETVLVPSIRRGAQLHPPSAGLPKSAWLPQGLGPMTYTPDTDPGFSGQYKRSFMQKITLPSTVAYAGGQAIGYTTFVNQYSDDNTYFGNNDSAGFIGIDLKRVIIGAKTLRVRKGFGDARLTILTTGFRTSQTYAHIVSSSGRLLRHVKVVGFEGLDPCGDRGGEILFNGATPGPWKVIVNTSKTSRATTGGAVGTIRVTR
jgi:hypothetical protein